MYAEFFTARIGMLKKSMTIGNERFLGLILVLIISSYVALPGNAEKTYNHDAIDCTGLIAVNNFQIS